MKRWTTSPSHCSCSRPLSSRHPGLLHPPRVARNVYEGGEAPIAGDCNPKAICGTARRVPNGGCTDEKADYSGIGATHHCRGADPSTLAAVIAQHSPAVRAFEKRVIVRLFPGSTSFGFPPVDAHSVVYRVS